MSDVNANVHINIDTTGALVNLKRLESEINSFQRTVASSNVAATGNQQALNKALLDGIRNTGLFDAKLVNAHDSISRFNDQLDRGKLSLGQYTRYAASQLPGMSKVFKKEFDTIQQVAESRVKKINTQYIALGKTVDGVTRAIAATPTSLGRGYATDLAIATQRQQLFNKMIDDGSTKLLNWGKNTQWAGRQLMVGFSIPMAALGTVAAKTFMEIDKSTVALKRVYGDLNTTTEEVNTNIAALKSLGKEYTKYGIALNETIDIGARAAATGARNEDLTAATEQTLRLATLGQIDYNQALDATISLQSAFGISSQNLGEAIDYLNVVENQTILTLDDMTLAVPRVATVIKGLGGDIKDLAVFMTAMREGGVSAENAANALKSGLASLINPTKAAKEFLGGVGINIERIVKTNKGDLMGIITTFGQALNSLGEFERQQALEKVFGKYQYARMGALFANITKDSSQAARAMDLAAMSAQELANVANKELSTVSESTTVKFQAAMEQLKIAIAPLGEAFLKGATPVINMVTKIAEAFNNLPDGVKNAVAVITAAVAGIGPILLMSIGLIGNGIANLVKGVQFFRRNLARLRGDGAAFDYMTNAELEAVAATNSLNAAGSNLTGTLNLQRNAVAALTVEYERFAAAAGIAGGAMRGVGGAPMPGGRGGRLPMPPVRRNQGGTIPGSGNTDTVPAMLTPGEFVVNKQATAENLPLLRAINGGQIPGYAGGGFIKMFKLQSSMIGGLRKTGMRSSRMNWEENPSVLPYGTMERQNVQSSRGRFWADSLLPEATRQAGLRRTGSGKVVGHVYSSQFYSRHGSSIQGASPKQTGSSLGYLRGGQRLRGGQQYDLLANQYVLFDERFNNAISSRMGATRSQWVDIQGKDMISLIHSLRSKGIPEKEALKIADIAAQKINSRIKGFGSKPITEKDFGKIVTGSSISALKTADSKTIFQQNRVALNSGGMVGGLRYSPPGGQVSQSRSFYGIPPAFMARRLQALRQSRKPVTPLDPTSRSRMMIDKDEQDLMGITPQEYEKYSKIVYGSALKAQGSDVDAVVRQRIAELFDNNQKVRLADLGGTGSIIKAGDHHKSSLRSVDARHNSPRVELFEIAQAKRLEQVYNELKSVNSPHVKGLSFEDFIQKVVKKGSTGATDTGVTGAAAIARRKDTQFVQDVNAIYAKQAYGLNPEDEIRLYRAETSFGASVRTTNEQDNSLRAQEVRKGTRQQFLTDPDMQAAGFFSYSPQIATSFADTVGRPLTTTSVKVKDLPDIFNASGYADERAMVMRPESGHRSTFLYEDDRLDLLKYEETRQLVANRYKEIEKIKEKYPIDPKTGIRVGGEQVHIETQHLYDDIKRIELEEKQILQQIDARHGYGHTGIATTEAYKARKIPLSSVHNSSDIISEWKRVNPTAKSGGILKIDPETDSYYIDLRYLDAKNLTKEDKNLIDLLQERLGLTLIDRRTATGLQPARLNKGNIVPGMGNKDTVPAMLTPGEFVVNKEATQSNLNLLHAINNGTIKGFNDGGDTIQSSRVGYSAPRQVARQTTQMQWQTTAREQDAARRAAERWGVTGTKLTNALEKVAAHIVAPPVGPLKAWVAKNLTPDLQAVNNYMNRVQTVSKNMLKNTETLQKISKSTGVSLERVQAELRNFAKGQHPITATSARVLEKVSSMDEAASRMAQAQGRRRNIFGARTQTGYLAGMTKSILRERRLGGYDLYRDRGRFRFRGPTIITRRPETQSTRGMRGRTVAPMTEPAPHAMVTGGGRQSYSDTSTRARQIMQERGLTGQQGRQEALRLARKEMAQPRVPMGGGKFGMLSGAAGGALMMGSMAPMMMGGESGKFLGMDSGTASMAMMGAGTVASIAPMLIPLLANPIGGAVAAVVATIAALGAGLYIFRKNIDDAARAAGDVGANLGGTANALTKISKVFGAATPAQRQQQLNLKMSDKELAKSYGEFQSVLESESGQAFIKELKDASSAERAKKFTDYLRAGLASGLFDEQQARKFAKVIGVAVGDSVMTVLAIRGISGLQSGSQGYLSIARARDKSAPQSALEAMNAIVDLYAPKTVPVIIGPDGNVDPAAAKNPFEGLTVTTPESPGSGTATYGTDEHGNRVRTDVAGGNITIDSAQASLIINHAIQTMADYSNVIALAKEDLQNEVITRKQYNDIIKEATLQQQKYANIIRNAIFTTEDLQATIQGIIPQFKELGMTEDEIKKFTDSIKTLTESEQGTLIAEAASALSQGMSAADIQAITDYVTANKTSVASKTMFDGKYGGQAYQLSGLSMMIESGFVPGMDAKDSQRAVDIAFNFTENGGTVEGYRQFLASLPESKIITIQTQLEGMSPSEQATFIGGYNSIAALGGIDLAVNVMFDENGKPKSGKDLADTVEKTNKALNKIKSGKTKAKKEGIISLYQEIRGSNGEQLTEEQAMSSWERLSKKFGEQKILSLPPDILSKVLIYDVQMSENTLEIIDLESKLATATGETRMRILQRLAELSQANKNLASAQAELIKGDYSGREDQKGGAAGGAGAEKTGLEKLKDTILERLKLFTNFTDMLKKFKGEKDKFGKAFSQALKQSTYEGSIPDQLRKMNLNEGLITEILNQGYEEAKKTLDAFKKNKKFKDQMNRAYIVGQGNQALTSLIGQVNVTKEQIRATNTAKAMGYSPEQVSALTGDENLMRMFLTGDKTVKKKIMIQVSEQVAADKIMELLNDPTALQEKQMSILQKQHKLEIAPQEEKINQLNKQKDLINDQISAIEKLNDKDRQSIRGLERKKEMIQRQIDQYQYQNELDQRRIDALRREDEIRNRRSEALSHDLEIMSQQEQLIRDQYQQRIDALNQVVQLNDHIVESQRQQLGLAQALSQGDIYAAAAAAQDMQASQGQYAREQQTAALQQGMENQVAGLTTAGGLTRQQAEEQINAIKEQSYQTGLKIREIEDGIYQRNLLIIPLKDAQYKLDLEIRDLNDAIFDRETNILNIQNTQLDPLQQMIDKEQKSLDNKNEQFDANMAIMQADIDRNQLAAEQQELIHGQTSQVGSLAKAWYAVNQQILNANLLMKQQLESLGEAPNPKPGEKPASYEARYSDWLTRRQDIINTRNTAVNAAYAKGVEATKNVGKPKNKKYAGGYIEKYADGNYVFGSGGRDSVPAMLTPGEFVVRKAMVKKYGLPSFNKMNMGSMPVFDKLRMGSLPTYSVQDNTPSISTIQRQETMNMFTQSVDTGYNNISVNVNVANTNASPDAIANKVAMKIDNINRRGIGNQRVYKQ